MAVENLVEWQDLNPSLKLAADGDIKREENVEAVYASLENILLTIMGERCMRRTFAINIKTLLFEPIIAETIRDVVVRDFTRNIEAWEPRVKVEWLDVQTNPDRGEIKIRFEFYIRGYDKVFEFDKTYQL